MTVTVVANPTFSPPRNVITVAVPAGDVMTAATLNRIVNGVATPVRTQPSTGLDTRTVPDYEMPYDQPATYQFITTYTDPRSITTLWDEVWSSLAAWTGATSSWSVSGGVASASIVSASSFSISRAVSPTAKYRVSCASLSGPFQPNASQNSGIFLMNGSTVVLQVGAQNGGVLLVTYKGTTTTTTISGASPFTIDLLDSSIVIKGTGGTYTVRTSSQISAIQLTAGGPGTTSVGRITIGAYAVPVTITESSAPVTVSPSSPWLIHPSNPGLSMPVGSPNRSTATIRTLGDITNPSVMTEHEILGQSLPITTTSGPRQGDRLQAVVGVRTAAQEQALLDLLSDGTAILFRAPAGYDIGLKEAFYSVGDVGRARLSQRQGDPLRNFTLPLTEVQSPVVAVQNVGWSWAALAAEFPTWQAVSQAFNTWADVLTNNRKPGY